ncbi:Eukaryotic rRNA processing [Trinorchestia longiramus]|nr:Eukaryotic rRNA processing [Trinorchestia longiramus]
MPGTKKFSAKTLKSDKKGKKKCGMSNGNNDVELNKTEMVEEDVEYDSDSESEQNGDNKFEEYDSEDNDSDEEEDGSDDDEDGSDDQEDGSDNQEDGSDDQEEDSDNQEEDSDNQEDDSDDQDDTEEESQQECGEDENNNSDEELDESNIEMNTENGSQSDSGDELDYVIDYMPPKKRFKTVTKNTEDDSKNGGEDEDEELILKDEDILDDENEEVLERVLAGKLKYGRTYEEDQNIKKEYINREEELQQKYEELHYKGDWLQRLDITCKAAPLAPEMQHAIEADKKIQSKKLPPLNNPFKDMSVLKDDFEREMLFQRHAQAAVLIGVPKLQDMKQYTRRNEEYYAEMVKSDKQMHKVRKNLQEKLLDRQASEHARKLRKMRKFGKKVQAEVILTKAQKKKELMTKLKEYRQGHLSDLDFLDGPGRSNAADDDDVAPYVRPRRGAPAGRRGGSRGGRRGRGGRGGRAEGGQGPRMRAVLVGDYRSRGGRGRGGRGNRGSRAGPAKRKQMRGGNRNYDKTKRGFTR